MKEFEGDDYRKRPRSKNSEDRLMESYAYDSSKSQLVNHYPGLQKIENYQYPVNEEKFARPFIRVKLYMTEGCKIYNMHILCIYFTCICFLKMSEKKN